jgi:replicative DNA helicase
VLGAILCCNDLLATACAGVEPRHFGDPLHRQFFGIISDLIRQGREADPITVRSLLLNNVIITRDGLKIPEHLGG